MLLLQCCLVMQALLSRAAAAYYHELSITTIEPPAPLAKDSFFGYSVAFQNNSVVASAPRADKEGQVFSCDLDNRNCTRMNIKIAGTREEYHCRDPKKTETCGNKHHSHHFWLGATVKADDKNLIVCAPRFTDKLQVIFPESVGFPMFGPNGICYIKENEQSVDTNFNKMTQISDEDRNINITRNENVTDAFGWSMDIDMKGFVRVGSPAPAAGRMMTYVDAREETNPKLLTSPYPRGFNFGYSIATGNFIEPRYRSRRTATKTPGVAIGTPYGEDGTGLVLFYDEKMNLQDIVKDPAGVGSIFSAALCAAKLDGTTTSLLVGAPAHFTGTNYHTGIVYVYRQEKGKNVFPFRVWWFTASPVTKDVVPHPQRQENLKESMKNVTEIEGPKKYGAFFGYAIANVGDMDHDGKDEIAIAAPYEDEGRGAVYLYAGSSLSDRKTEITWLQRFQPEDPKFQSVGLSLVADKYFGNGCNALAVGAPGNDRVAVYRCLTVITVNIQATVPDLQNRVNKAAFAFQLCLNATYPPKPENIYAEFEVRVKITHLNATLTDAVASNDYVDYVEKLDKIKNPNGCREIKVTTPESGDYDQEIQFNITAKLLNDPMHSKDFNSSRASVSAHSHLTSSTSVRAAECKEEPCAPKLTVKLTTNVTSPYQIGSTKTVAIGVSVSNGEADTAYRPCVRVRTSGATVHSAPSNCKFVDDSQRDCQLQRPLKANTTWEVTTSENYIELGLTLLTSKSDQIQVYAEVFNHCEISKKPDDNQTITFNLTTDASGLKLESKTDQGKEVPFNRNDVKLGKTLHHTYTITNIGEINWVNIISDIRLYKQPYITYNNSIQVYSGDTARSLCEVKEHTDKSGSSNFTGISCSLGDLSRKEYITVVIPITVLPGALEKVFDTANGTVETFLRIHAESHEREKIELTTLVLQDATVPLWVIVVASIVGIIIVILMAIALRECGLLRRKSKEKLENLQKEVKRKSMMLQRQSMRLTESARAELSKLTYRELLDAAEIKEAEEAEEAEEAGKSIIEDRRINVEDTPKKGKGPTTALNGKSSVSNLDLRAQIEKSLQKQNVKAQSSKDDKTPLYDESEI